MIFTNIIESLVRELKRIRDAGFTVLRSDIEGMFNQIREKLDLVLASRQQSGEEKWREENADIIDELVAKIEKLKRSHRRVLETLPGR